MIHTDTVVLILDLTKFSQYLSSQDTKYPRNRPLIDNLKQLSQTVTRIDDDVKNKSYSYA